MQIREFAGQDNTDLFLEEREAQLRSESMAQQARQMQVPGITGPNEQQMDG